MNILYTAPAGQPITADFRDRVARHIGAIIDDGYNAIRAFVEYLGEQGLVIVPHTELHKVVQKAVQAEVLLAFRMGHRETAALEAERIASEVAVTRADPQKLLDELYDVDQGELERERRALLRYNHLLHIQAKED